MSRCRAVVFLGLVGCIGAPGDPDSDTHSAGTEPVSASEGSLSILSYNVHGLPPLITGDDTLERMVQIAPRLAPYDVIGLQEDWDGDNHEVLLGSVDHQTRSWFEETLPGRYYGSGLTVLARQPVLAQTAVHFSSCSGTVSGASDCLASKGVQAVRVDLGGVSVDLLNTHLEAGGGAEDNAARSVQVDEVIAVLNGFSAGQAVIFTGDFNMRSADPDDAPLLERLTSRGGLVDACAAVDCPEPDHIDRVFLRSSTEVLLRPTGWANATSAFLDDAGTDLSDHPPIGITVDWLVVESGVSRLH